jgi:hypothetical protein
MTTETDFKVGDVVILDYEQLGYSRMDFPTVLLVRDVTHLGSNGYWIGISSFGHIMRVYVSQADRYRKAGGGEKRAWDMWRSNYVNHVPQHPVAPHGTN